MQVLMITPDFHLLYVGRLEYKKGVDLLVESMKRLHDRGEQTIFLDICGDGTQRDTITRKIEEYGLKGQIRCHGYVSGEELYKQYREADLVVIPSREESFGMVVLEAMAQKTCVLCSDLPRFQEIVGDEGAFYFQTGDSEELTRQILKLRKDPLGRDSAIQTAMRRVQEHYTWQHVAQETREVYESIKDTR